MNEDLLIRELEFKAVRSGGAGGQHVNKVATKVVLSFDLESSQALSSEEKELLREVLGKRLSTQHRLILSSDATRSQHGNKELVTRRFLSLIRKSLEPVKARKKTRPGRAAVEKRLEDKKKTSEKKSRRRNPPSEL